MSENTQVEKVEQVSAEVIYLQSKAEIESQIATARAFPRDVVKFVKSAMALATLNEEVAESCYYAMPRKKRNDKNGQDEVIIIEGPSVRLAEIVASTYGNIAIAARVISNDGKSITAQDICRDLENNVSTNVEVKARITYRNGATFNDDLQVMIGNAACSKARRNAIFATIPGAIIKPILDKAKEVAKGSVAELAVRRNKALEYFHGLGVSDEQICKTLSVSKIEDIDIDKFVQLRGFASAIKNEGKTIQDIFNIPAAAEPSAETKTAVKEKTASLKKSEAVKRAGEIEKELLSEIIDEQRGFLEMELEELKAKHGI